MNTPLKAIDVQIPPAIWIALSLMWAFLIGLGFLFQLPNESFQGLVRFAFWVVLIAHFGEGFIGAYFGFQAKQNPVKWFLLTMYLGFPAWTALRRAIRKAHASANAKA